MIQPQIPGTVAGYHTFAAFIKHTLLRRPQAPPYHSAAPDSYGKNILIFQKQDFLKLKKLVYTQTNRGIS